MLPSRRIIFTAIEGILDDHDSHALNAISDALEAIARRGIPLVLCSRGTRAQLDPLRRKLEHAHPFMTESGGGLFIPDGYFNMHLEGAIRTGRQFCVPFARSRSEAVAALSEIADEAGAGVVGLSQMSHREIAQNSGLPTREAELYAQREFSESFFFTGETDKAARRFSDVAREKGWRALAGGPFWELRAPANPNGGSALSYLMNAYRKALHSRQNSVGIGADASDLYFLGRTDSVIVLRGAAGEFDDALAGRFPGAMQASKSGAAGWNEALLELLEKA